MGCSSGQSCSFWNLFLGSEGKLCWWVWGVSTPNGVVTTGSNGYAHTVGAEWGTSQNNIRGGKYQEQCTLQFLTWCWYLDILII